MGCICGTMKISDLRKAMASGDIDACYKLVSADKRTKVCITPELVDKVVQTVVNAGLRKVTSVGCGTGLFEWFLSKKLGQPVVGIEIGGESFSCALVSDFPMPCFNHVCIFVCYVGPDDDVHDFDSADVVLRYTSSTHVTINVDHDTALLFVWGTKAPWTLYLENYRGNCVIFVHPEDFRNSNKIMNDKKLDSGWHLHYTDPDIGMYVFTNSPPVLT